MVPRRVNCYCLNVSHGQKKTSRLKPSIFFISIWFRHADLQRHQFLLQAFLLGKVREREANEGSGEDPFARRNIHHTLRLIAKENIYLNLLHQLMWPFLSLISFMGKSCVSPFTHRPLRRCGPVQPWSLVNQRIAVPTNSSRFPPQINNQGGQGRVYPESVYPWYVAFLLWFL